jgi:hypothetical protein
MGILIRRKGGKFWFVLALFVGMLFLSSGSVFATKFFNTVNVSNMPDQVDTSAAIAIDQNNKVHIAWNGFYAQQGAPDGVAADVFYTTNKDGSFRLPLKISVPTGWYSRDVTIAVDPSGNVHIAFRRSEDQMNITAEDDLYYVTNALGDFNNPVLLVDGDIYLAEVIKPYSPRIHCDTQGHVHLTFLADGLNGSSMVVGYMNNSIGTWSEPIVAAAGTSPNEHNSCLDKNGYIHIAYGDVDDTPPDYPWRIYYTNNTSGSFATPTPVSPYDENAHEPNLAVDSKGKAHIVYREPFVTPGTPDLFYVNNIGGSFSSGPPISDWSGYYVPTIACDASDFVHIAYKEAPAYGGALYYGNNIEGDFSFVTYSLMSEWWFPDWSQSYLVLGKNGTMHFAFYDWVGDVYDSDTEIYYLGGSWLIKDDFVGTWDGQGVYYRSSDTGGWAKMSSPADSLTVGDLDGDAIDDLIGIWPGQGGVWIKYSKTAAWSKLSSTARHIAAGDMNGDGRVDILGTWDGQGVYYRNSMNGAWVKMASPATLITAGDLDGDGKADLIGIWPSQGGVWVKYSKTGAWSNLSSTAKDIAAGDINGDGRDDLLATWDGQGVYYRNSMNGAWVKMSTPADQVTAGDLDGDGKDDAIGIWPTQGGVWVKYSETGSWAKLSSSARDIAAGKMRAGTGGSMPAQALFGPLGGYAQGPESLIQYQDTSSEGPGGLHFVYQTEEQLIPQEHESGMLRIPGPEEPGFRCVEEKNLFPLENKERR